jgi:hypothetical protein
MSGRTSIEAGVAVYVERPSALDGLAASEEIVPASRSGRVAEP